MEAGKQDILSRPLIEQVKAENNFDFIRFFLAYSVMFNHFSTLTDTDPFWLVSGGFRVKGFFIISGFLVMFSYLRTPDNGIFFRKRLHRIMPAYLLTIGICFLIGLLLTTLPWQAFLANGQSWKYLLSNLLTFNFICPDLPGVFEQHPMHAMNGSLWTIKVELMLYLCVPLIYQALKRYNKAIVLILIYLLSFSYLTLFDGLDDLHPNSFYGFLKRQFPGQMTYFLSGVIWLVYFPFFKRGMRYIFPLSLLIFYFRDCWLCRPFEPLALAAIILTVAYSFRALHIFNRMGNFSYGIFLAHFPVIQCLIHFGLDKYSFGLTLALTTLLSTVIGILSWKYIEQPCLYKGKKKTSHSADKT